MCIRDRCWGKEYGDNIKQFAKITNMVKSGESADPDAFSEPLSERCPKKQELIDKIRRLCDVYVASSTEKRRIARMRNILTAQLSATEQILSQLSDEIENSGEIAKEKVQLFLERIMNYKTKAENNC